MMKTTRKSKSKRKKVGATRHDRLAEAYRRWGYLHAQLDALGRLEPYEHPDIADAAAGAKAEDIARWHTVYGGSIGVEFGHIEDRGRSQWIADRMEGEAPDKPDESTLDRIAQAELFERFLHARYVGTKRYSLEGVAGLIPLIDSILETFASQGGELVVVAMSHRGRLNVMANVVGIPGAELFAGLEDVDARSVLGSGDVKYHLGATGAYETRSGKTVKIHLVSNPSHLEAVDPVVMGRVRAKQDRAGSQGRDKILPLTLHGDAAFAGQGITAETMNFADLPGYTVGGTIHIIVNNLIGFTADDKMLHSSRFASDLAKRLSVPIFHVNGEDPEALARVGGIAVEYHKIFKEDVFVDLIGYRRYGHSEVEDPSTTQPLLYKRIKDRPMLWELYADRLGKPRESLETIREAIWNKLTVQQEKGREIDDRPLMRTLPGYWDAYTGDQYHPGLEVDTGVPIEHLKDIGARLCEVPDGFHAHPKIARVVGQRRAMINGDHPLDWGVAEGLAFGSLLWEGMPVRLAGEDSRRGTFNQRNAALIDVENGEEYVPLAHLHADQGRLTLVDSPLSEAAALGYEYGYSRDYPDALVCWEAQFGDFANGAQTIIDQFIAAGEDKWRLLSGLVMMLPHGYEGQGPEHSSARLERFLQLAAEDNMQIAQPATACHYFHLLRRQALIKWRKPLVLLTPKSLLRAPRASSSIESLTSSSCFGPVSPDSKIENAQRVLICSGKISHELEAERDRRHDKTTAIITLVQLYPFPSQQFEEEMRKHPSARKVMWVQEEPANMGALSYVRPILQRLLGSRHHLTTVRRSESASPATGSAKAHALEQVALINLAFA
jgi:2-oxoglutarate dehydrogenase E1 component